MTLLGKILRKLRIDHNELLFDMAQALGVSSAFLSAVENGKKSAPIDWVDKIVARYQLGASQAQELRNAADETAKQVRISLEHQTRDKRDLVLTFARRFDEMTDEEINAMRAILQNKITKEGS